MFYQPKGNKADGSRIGLQESIDSAQAILRETYGDSLDTDAQSYIQDSDEDEDEDDLDEDEDDF